MVGGGRVEELVDLALGITGTSGTEHTIVIDGTEAIPQPAWRKMLASIRTLDGIVNRMENDPDRVRMLSRLSWVLIGTRDVQDVYDFISGSATPFSPFLRISVSPFSKADVQHLAEAGFESDTTTHIADSIFRRTSGFRFLTQRFLHEAFSQIASRQRYAIREIEEAVSQHDDPNWKALLKVAEESGKAASVLESIANGEKVLNIGHEPHIRALLRTGVFVASDHFLHVGNSYYSQRVEKLWRSRPIGKQLGKEQEDRLKAIRARKELSETRTLTVGPQGAFKNEKAGDESFRYDFFISYTSVDRPWAEWIAWQLEESGYRVLIQAWDFVAGSHWVNQMNQAMQESARTLAILSPEYLSSAFAKAEWQEAFRSDPEGLERRLIPVRVAPCERPGLLGQVVSFDLFGLVALAAKQRLLEHVKGSEIGRAKPLAEPTFPGRHESSTTTRRRTLAVSDAPPFPPERPPECG